MSKQKVVVAGTNVSAQQLSEIFRQIGTREIDERVIQNIIEHRNPWPHWTREAYSVSFDVVTNGMTGEEWINHFERKGHPLDTYTKSVLLSNNFQPEKVGETHHIVVVDIRLYGESFRTIESISIGSSRHHLRKTSAEVICLICDNFTSKNLAEMRFEQIIAMHKPIPDGLKGCFLGTDGLTIKTHHVSPEDIFVENFGFAFEG